MKKSTAATAKAHIYVILNKGKLSYHLIYPYDGLPVGRVVGCLTVAEYAQDERKYQDYFNQLLSQGNYSKKEDK